MFSDKPTTVSKPLRSESTVSSPVKIEHSPRTKPNVQAQCTSQAKPIVSSLRRLVSWYESGPTSQAFTSSLKSAYGVKSMVSSLQCPVYGVKSTVSCLWRLAQASRRCAKYKFVKPSRSKVSSLVLQRWPMRFSDPRGKMGKAIAWLLRGGERENLKAQRLLDLWLRLSLRRSNLN